MREHLSSPKSDGFPGTLERRARSLLDTPSAWGQRWPHLRLSGDRVFHGIFCSVACGILVLAGLLGYELVRHSWLALTTFGLGFLTGTTWDPVAQRFGVLPFLYGTIVSS